MNPSSRHEAERFRPILLDRRARLRAVASAAPNLDELIAEVDAALERIESGTFGLCETCCDTIEADRLASDPLTRWCLDHLSREELRAHQEDIDMASQIQLGLLPPRTFTLKHWDTHYRYAPIAAVGGDYCELIVYGGESLFFAVGDVAGKGVAASLLMTHLSAIFRSLLTLDLPLAEVVLRANRLFCESTSPSHFATLACGRTAPEGLEICNAGHCAPLLLQEQATQRFESNGLPLGLFRNAEYRTHFQPLDDEESVVLYSDGITEALSAAGQEFEEERLVRSLRRHLSHNLGAMAEGVLRDHARFRETRPPHDDMTLLIVRRLE